MFENLRCDQRAHRSEWPCLSPLQKKKEEGDGEKWPKRLRHKKDGNRERETRRARVRTAEDEWGKAATRPAASTDWLSDHWRSVAGRTKKQETHCSSLVNVPCVGCYRRRVVWPPSTLVSSALFFFFSFYLLFWGGVFSLIIKSTDFGPYLRRQF